MKKILSISDIHGGSRGAPVANGYIQTVPSGILYEQWCNMVDNVQDIDICIINGDLIEGLNKKKHGLGTYTTDFMEQSDIVVELLKMIKAREFVFSLGSGYHVTSEGINIEHMISKFVNGKWVGEHGFLNVENVKIHLRHWTNFSSIPYNRFNAMQKDAAVDRLNNIEVDLYLRAHTHHYGFSGTKHSTSITSPSWKVLDEYMSAKSSDIPDNGYVVINVDDKSYSWNPYIFTVPIEKYTPVFNF